jgi:hypothetical protein
MNESSTPDNSWQDGSTRGPAKRRKTSHTLGKPMAQNMDDRLTDGLERDQDDVEGEQPVYPQVNATVGDPHTLKGSAIPTFPETSTASSDEESDDGSIFQVLGDQGNGGVSCLCAHCQYIFDNWSKGFNDRVFRFPHYRDTFQLERSATGGCALCAQFLQSKDTRDLQEARDEMKELGLESVDAPGVSAQTYSYSLYRTKLVAAKNERIFLNMPFLRPPASDADHDLEDNFWREIITFSVDMVPAALPGKHTKHFLEAEC